MAQCLSVKLSPDKKSDTILCVLLSSLCVCVHCACDQLLKTADSSTSDVSGLHAKLDRKRNVETHNASVQEKFHVDFHGGIDVLTSHVKGFVAKQEQFSSSMCNTFGKYDVSLCQYSNWEIL